MNQLKDLIITSEDRIIKILIQYAIKLDYIKYTSTLEEAWRISINQLSTLLINLCNKQSDPIELKPDDIHEDDPLTQFGIIEAKLHRQRGIDIVMFMGLLKYYRQSYLDVLLESNLDNKEKYKIFIDRFYDKIELGIFAEWSKLSDNTLLSELRNTNRIITNEKNKYLTVFENLPHPAIILDNNFYIDHINSAAINLFNKNNKYDYKYYNHLMSNYIIDEENISSKLLVKIKLNDMFPNLSPMIIEFVSKYKENQITYDYQITIEGEILYFEIKISKMLDISKKFTGYILIMTDVTNRVETEKILQISTQQLQKTTNELDAIFNSVPISIWYKDLYGNYIRVNKTAADVLNLKPEDINGKPVKTFFPFDYEEFYKSDLEIINSGKLKLHQIEKVQIKKNQYRWFQTDKFPYKDEHGNILGVIIYSTDITEHKMIEEEKNRIEEQLLHSHKMEAIGTLAGGIAHDFNNILSPIIGYSEMLALELEDHPNLKKEALEIQKAGYRAKELVLQILSLSRKKEIEKSPIKIKYIVKEVLSLLKSSIPSTIEIKSNINHQHDYNIFANSTQIHQVIMNICTNAAHSMEDRIGILELIIDEIVIDKYSLLSYKSLVPGNYVRLSISDTGVGMTTEVQERIFDPYFTTKKIGEGTGLGLSIVYNIIKNHNGFIYCYSEINKGTIFKILLPIIQNTKDINNDYIKPLRKGNEKILLVDDEQSLLDLEKKMLEKLGHKVTLISDSVKALEIFKQNPNNFDLVITDQTMPNMTGFELSKQILKIKKNIPIIICTGYSRILDIEKANNLGIKGFLMKPLVMSELSKEIEKILGKGKK